jgi:hypothetical protein
VHSVFYVNDRLFSHSFFFAVQTLTTTLRYVTCLEVSPGVSVVFSSPAIRCEDTEYKRWLVLAWLLIIVDVIAAPIFLFVFLVRNRRRIANDVNFRARYGNNKKFRWDYRTL